jgi:hypothetical protein
MRLPLMIAHGISRRVPSVAIVVAIVLAIGGSLLPVAADDYGPQMSVDRNVAERGAIVTVALNGFPANQTFVLLVRPEGYPDQTAAIVTLPVNVDASGGAAATLSTAGFAPGNYIVTVAPDAASAPLLGVGTAFGVIDGGTLGPRVVRTYPAPRSDREEG